jgi:hypothetical protein
MLNKAALEQKTSAGRKSQTAILTENSNELNSPLGINSGLVAKNTSTPDFNQDFSTISRVELEKLVQKEKHELIYIRNEVEYDQGTKENLISNQVRKISRIEDELNTKIEMDNIKLSLPLNQVISRNDIEQELQATKDTLHLLENSTEQVVGSKQNYIKATKLKLDYLQVF